MRERLQPLTAYDGERGYPSMADCSLSRRGFLRRLVVGAGAGAAAAVTGTAGLAGAALLPHPEALAAPRRAWLKAVVRLHPPHHLRGYQYRRVDKIVLQTRSGALHRFLTLPGEQKGVVEAMRSVLKAASVADIEDRKRLARLESKVGSAVSIWYHARTRKRVEAPLATLVILRMERPQDPGFLGAPPAPMPAP